MNIHSTTSDLPVISFETQKEWEQWLTKNHDSSKGIWMRCYKKNSGVKSINYAEALDEALCYGWIDGQRNKYDEKSYLQRFTPRRPRSLWSQRNTEYVARLIKLGKMKPSGLKQVEAAQANGRWEQAYGGANNMVIPEDFLKEVAKSKKTQTFFDTLSKSNLFAIYWRLQTAKKSETRERRIKAILEMLKNGKTLYD